MILLPPDLRDRLLVNGRVPDADHVPVVKFFNPLGEGVWLATELDPDCQFASNCDPLFASNVDPSCAWDLGLSM